jgi:hypothetical protein
VTLDTILDLAIRDLRNSLLQIFGTFVGRNCELALPLAQIIVEFLA